MYENIYVGIYFDKIIHMDNMQGSHIFHMVRSIDSTEFKIRVDSLSLIFNENLFAPG